QPASGTSREDVDGAAAVNPVEGPEGELRAVVVVEIAETRDGEDGSAGDLKTPGNTVEEPPRVAEGEHLAEVVVGAGCRDDDVGETVAVEVGVAGNRLAELGAEGVRRLRAPQEVACGTAVDLRAVRQARVVVPARHGVILHAVTVEVAGARQRPGPVGARYQVAAECAAVASRPDARRRPRKTRPRKVLHGEPRDVLVPVAVHVADEHDGC